jgi:protein phosphatase
VSDAGRVRKTNEDKFVSDLELGLFAVADGMGGHKAGEVAAQIAIETVAGFVGRSAHESDVTWPYGIDEALSFDGNRLRTAIFLANRKVFRAAERTDDYGGMGTTFVGVLVNGAQASIGSVGDSRLYLMSNGSVKQMTVDDSWAATILAQDPTLTPEAIAQHPMRNVLTNVLGARESVEVHLIERTLQAGETLLLCTDGIHNVLSPDGLRDILTKNDDVERAAQVLIDMALDRGSRDNVTALLVRYEAD